MNYSWLREKYEDGGSDNPNEEEEEVLLLLRGRRLAQYIEHLKREG